MVGADGQQEISHQYCLQDKSIDRAVVSVVFMISQEQDLKPEFYPDAL